MSVSITLELAIVRDRCKVCRKVLRPEQLADISSRLAEDVGRPLLIVEVYCAPCAARRPS